MVPTMRGSRVPLLALCMVALALYGPITEAQQQASKRSSLKGVPPSQSNTLKWISESDVAFTRKVTHRTNTTLVTPWKGLYYIYCQVGFGGTSTNLRLSSEVITWSDSFNSNVTLLVGSETITGPPLGHKLWRTSLNQGGLANLKAGQKLYVHVSHPELVDYTEGKTFFGLVLVS